MLRWLLFISKSLRSDNSSRQKIVSAAIIVSVLLVDLVTKRLVLGIASPIPVIKNFFDIVHIENSSAAVGMSFFLPEWMLRYLLIIVSIVFVLIIVYQLFIKADNPYYIAFSLILAGALGNLWQRIFQGEVTDFLYFHINGFYWPAFNIADSAITIGAVLFFIKMYLMNDSNKES